MIRFLAVQHTFAEFLGALELQFESRALGFTYLRPVTGQDVFANALSFDGLWLLGGAWPVADTAHAPWAGAEIKLVRAFERARRPVVGLGFGAHIVAMVHGGAASTEPAHDAYWTTAHAVADDPVAQALDGRRVLVMANGRVDFGEAPGAHATRPIAVDDAGRWIALRPAATTYALLVRPELKPGMIEDMIMEADRPMPDHIGALLDEARAEWPATQVTTDRVVAALVAALGLMDERRKMPVFTMKAVKGDQ